MTEKILLRPLSKHLQDGRKIARYILLDSTSTKSVSRDAALARGFLTNPTGESGAQQGLEATALGLLSAQTEHCAPFAFRKSGEKCELRFETWQ